MSHRILFAVALAGFLTGCGGQVVFVEDDGSGASGAGGAGPGPGPGPGSGPSQTSSSTSSGVENICQQYCGTWSACTGGDCVAECESLFGTGCDTELTAALVCLTNNFTGCEGSVPCTAELEAYGNCQAPPSDCVTDSCDNGPDSCYCAGVCYGDLKLEQQCFFAVPGDGNGGQPGPPPPPSTCDCFLDGGYIGSCDNFDFVCNLEEGCCQNLIGGIGE